MAHAREAGWSYSTGERGVNKVRAYEKGESAFLEFYVRPTPSAGAVRKRVSLGRCERDHSKLKTDELAAALRRLENPQASTLTLHALFYNWYLKEVTPQKSKGKQRHDVTCAEMSVDASENGGTRARSTCGTGRSLSRKEIRHAKTPQPCGET
jgi:hypothetical protein